jgi:hypothetical protein
MISALYEPLWSVMSQSVGHTQLHGKIIDWTYVGPDEDREDIGGIWVKMSDARLIVWTSCKSHSV